MKNETSGESYDKDVELLPEVSSEIIKEITAHAVMDAEVYLADLYSKNRTEEFRDPTDNEISLSISKYNDFRQEHKQEIMNEQEKEIYELAFYDRFAEGYKETKVN